jgi:purine catabolism regulator
MVTVGDCLQLKELSKLTVIAGRAGLGRPVRLTHAVDEPDIFAWVMPDIIVLTTGHNLPDDPEAWAELVRALDARGVSALMVSPGRYLTTLPRAAVNEAERLAFPLIVVPWEVRFIEITEAIHRLIITNHINTWSHVAELEVRITETVAHAETLDGLLEALSRLFGHTVRLEVDAPPEAGHAWRWRLPAPELGAWTLVVEAVELSDAEMIVARQIAGALAIWLLQQKISRRSQFEAQAALFERLLNGEWEDSPAIRERLRRLGLAPGRPVRLLLLSLPDNLSPSKTRDFDDARLLLEQLMGPSLVLVTNHQAGLLSLLRDERQTAQQLTTALGPYFARFPKSVGVFSGPAVFSELPAIQNTLTRVWPLLSEGHVHDLSQVVFPAIILHLPEDLIEGLVSTTWARVTDPTLRETLRVLVETGGHRSLAAMRLGIHRNTMTHRLQHIEMLLGQPLTPSLLTQLDVARQWLTVKGTMPTQKSNPSDTRQAQR